MEAKEKGIHELKTDFDKWMYRVFILAEIGKFTAEEYKQYIKSLDEMSDYYNVIDTAVEEAEKRGRAEGREEAKMATAKNLKQLGVDVETIAKATGLSKDVIENL